MKKLTQAPPPPVQPTPYGNTLLVIHDRFMNFCNVFRDKVCKECSYSFPTYYRKAKGLETKISNAEREKIKKIERECIRVLMQHAGMSEGDFSDEAA